MRRWVILVLLMPEVFGGVNKLIQQEYRQRWENQTVFLSMPLYGSRQRVNVTEAGGRPVAEGAAISFKVGEQVRILELSFHDQEIRFKLGSIDAARQGEIAFRFAAELDDGFSARRSFDAALKQAFAEGQNYSDVDRTRREFIRRELEGVVAQMMAGTAANRDFVMDALADALPAHKQALDENRQLRDRNQDLQSKLSAEQGKARQLENRTVEQTSEINRLKSMNQSLKTDYDALNSSSTGASAELRQLRAQATEITTSIKRLQRGLGIEAEASKPLAKQVEEVMVAALRTKGDRDAQEGRLKASEGDMAKVRQELEQQKKENAELKKENAQHQDNIKLLSNRGDQLGQRYLNLQRQKGQLETFLRAVQQLQSRVVEEKIAGERRRRVIELRLNETPLGNLEIDAPLTLKLAEKGTLRVRFTAESINVIKLTDDEKKLLAVLGEKLTLRQELLDLPDGVTAAASEGAAADQVVAERSSGEWSWTLDATKIGALEPLVSTSLAYAPANAFTPILQTRVPIESVNLAKQIAGYLSPVPLGLGILFGLILMALIASLRSRSRHGLR